MTPLFLQRRHDLPCLTVTLRWARRDSCACLEMAKCSNVPNPLESREHWLCAIRFVFPSPKLCLPLHPNYVQNKGVFLNHPVVYSIGEERSRTVPPRHRCSSDRSVIAFLREQKQPQKKGFPQNALCLLQASSEPSRAALGPGDARARRGASTPPARAPRTTKRPAGTGKPSARRERRQGLPCPTVSVSGIIQILAFNTTGWRTKCFHF